MQDLPAIQAHRKMKNLTSFCEYLDKLFSKQTYLQTNIWATLFSGGRVNQHKSCIEKRSTVNSHTTSCAFPDSQFGKSWFWGATWCLLTVLWWFSRMGNCVAFCEHPFRNLHLNVNLNLRGFLCVHFDSQIGPYALSWRQIGKIAVNHLHMKLNPDVERYTPIFSDGIQKFVIHAGVIFRCFIASMACIFW